MMIGRSRSIPTVFFRTVVRERRRLLIDLVQRIDDGRRIDLNESERHYLRRVLRLRVGDQVDVVNGLGGLWLGTLEDGDRLTLTSALGSPQRSEPRSSYGLGLAVALMRRDSDIWIRMACELGIDWIQPVLADRCAPQAEHRPERWQTIVRESVEQCERLWAPIIYPVVPLQTWLTTMDGRAAMAVTRLSATASLSEWLKDDPTASTTWLLVGPEGGWSQTEEGLVESGQLSGVSLGMNILRSSTAAVRGAVELVKWREAQQN